MRVSCEVFSGWGCVIGRCRVSTACALLVEFSWENDKIGARMPGRQAGWPAMAECLGSPGGPFL